VLPAAGDGPAVFTIGPKAAQGPPLVGEGGHAGRAEVHDFSQSPANPPGLAQTHFTVDTRPPKVTILEPANNTHTSAETVTARVQVDDLSPILSVLVNDVAATLGADGQYTATGVPVGQGTVEAVAKDAALNLGTDSVTLTIDRDPPQVKITSPDADAWVKGPQVEVRGTVKDASPTLVEVNGQAELEPSEVLDRTFRALVSAGD